VYDESTIWLGLAGATRLRGFFSGTLLFLIDLFPTQGGANHGSRAANPAVDGDRGSGAVELAGPAFHALPRFCHLDGFFAWQEDPVWANVNANFTIDAPFGLVAQAGFNVRIEH
jgi:hypothetical protein